MLPILTYRVICPDCQRRHGKYPWEAAYWKVRAEASVIVDGGPVWTSAIRCSACERARAGRTG